MNGVVIAAQAADRSNALLAVDDQSAGAYRGEIASRVGRDGIDRNDSTSDEPGWEE